jgi:membrane protein DedA with SNARE-associated domain
MLPFLFGAGAMQYPVRKFLIALTLGRIIRYTLLAFLAARYGRPILALSAQHGHPGLLIVVGLVATGVAILFVIFAGKRQQHRSS